MKEKCKVEWCSLGKRSKGYCGKHYMQMKTLGEIKKRTKFDPNEIIVNGDICTMFLYDAKGNKIAETIFNTEHLEDVKKHKWCLLYDKEKGKDKGHVATPSKEIGSFKFIKLHNFLMGHVAEREIQVDHKNRNSLNNLDNNLRLCHESKNYLNRGMNSRNTSGYKGVSWHKTVNKWEAYIFFNYKKIGLGCFESKEEAKKVRDEAVIKIHGKFGVTNEELGNA